jgi:hypothetical protein
MILTQMILILNQDQRGTMRTDMALDVQERWLLQRMMSVLLVQHSIQKLEEFECWMEM